MNQQITDREIAVAAMRWYEARLRRLAASKHNRACETLVGIWGWRPQIQAEERRREARRLESHFLRLLSKACRMRRGQAGDVEDAQLIEAMRLIE